MSKYKKVIFVCTGNTCRSPMAEAIFRNLERDGDIKVFSRGIVVLFGEPINPKAEIVLKKYDMELANHRAKGLKEYDIDENTLVLTMTQDQKRKVLQSYPNSVDANVYTIKEFAGETGDVVDPYGGSLVDYEECYKELARLVKKTVYKINEHKEKEEAK